MSEIHNRGPIACTVGCTGNFDLNYTKGIYAEMGDFPVIFLFILFYYLFSQIILFPFRAGIGTKKQRRNIGLCEIVGAMLGSI
jgi:hypothetical protein